MRERILLLLFLFAASPVVLTACGPSEEPGENQGSYGDGEAGDGETGDGDGEAGDGDGENGDGDGAIELSITGISPTSGPSLGGTRVTLNGTGFEDGMEVFFGDQASADVNRFSQLSAEARTPTRAVGVVDVRVVNPDGEEFVLPGAFEYVPNDQGGNDEPMVDYCQIQPQSTAASPRRITTEEAANIRAYVFVEGVTEGAGAGSGVFAQFGYGSEFGDFQWAPMTYHGDVDGLNAGDLANDEYIFEGLIEEAGEYLYLARFRAEGDDDWVVCGAGGPIFGTPSEGAFGHLVVEEPTFEAPRPESCGIQFPLIAQSLVVGESFELYGRIFEPGVTDQADLPTSLLAEVLIGTPGANPEDEPGEFEVFSAARNLQYVSDDFEEFEVTAMLASAGLYAYVFRFSLDDGDHWTYCDIQGPRTEEEIVPAAFGALVVFDEAPELIDYCRTFDGSLFGNATGDGPEVGMEIYQEGVTDQGGTDDTGAFEVEVGFGAINTNPALSFQWIDLPFSEVSPFAANNHNYAGPVFEAANNPGEGDYSVITRARLVGEDAWTYCNHDPGTPDFFLGLATVMTLDP